MAVTQDNHGRAVASSIVLYAKSSGVDPEELDVSDYSSYEKWADANDLGLRANFPTTFEDMLKWVDQISDEDIEAYKQHEALDDVVKAKTIEKPFADYEDFSACVSDNSDKEDPEAYCAQIHYNATGEWPAEKASDCIVWNNFGGDPFGDYDVLERFCEDLEDKGAEVLLGDEPWEHATGHHDRPVKAYGITVEEADDVWEDYEEDAMAITDPKAKLAKDRPDVKKVEKVETDEEPVGKAFIHRREYGDTVFLKQEEDPGGWVPYEGPQGGTGWEHTETGRRVYDDEPPGPTAEFVEDGQLLEGVTSIDDVTPGDEISVGDEIYEVEAVEEGPAGQMYTRVEHDGQAFTITEDQIDVKVLGEAINTGDYDVERGTYEEDLAEALTKGGMTDTGSDQFQNVREMQHNLSDVNNANLLLDVLNEEATTRKSPTALDRIKGRLSALEVEDSRIENALPKKGIDLDSLGNVSLDEVAPGQEVVLDPSGYPGLTEPMEGEVDSINNTGIGMDAVYIEPEEEGFIDEKQVLEINGERYEVDRIYTDDDGNPDPSFVDPEDKTPILPDDYPEFDDLAEEATIVEQNERGVIPVAIEDLSDDLYYQDGERPDDPYPAVGYDSAEAELRGSSRTDFYGSPGFNGRKKIQSLDKIRRIRKHASDEELRAIVDDSSANENTSQMAAAMLYKRDDEETQITDVFNFDRYKESNAGTNVHRVMDSARDTMDDLNPEIAGLLAYHTNRIELDEYNGSSSMGCYHPSSQAVTIDRYSNGTAEDVVAHELGHSLHYLMGFSSDDTSDERDTSGFSYNVGTAGVTDVDIDDDIADLHSDFIDFVEQYEEDLNAKPTYLTHLRSYQDKNSNEIFAVAFGQWIDDPTKLKHEQPELHDIFEEYFGSGDTE